MPSVTAPPSGTVPCPPPGTEHGPCIPALTPVRIVIKAHLGSKISLTDQTFPIALAQPIVVDGKDLIPAGTTGMGEVVHAKKSGGSGASGELVLAARYLDIGGRRLRLRSLDFSVAGQSKIDDATRIATATSLVSPVLSVVAFFIQGKPIDIPEGMEAMAKTAEPFVLDPPLAVPPAPVSPQPEQGATP